jgi:hypothetical protein
VYNNNIKNVEKKNKNQISIVIEIFNIKKYNRIKSVIYNFLIIKKIYYNIKKNLKKKEKNIHTLSMSLLTLIQIKNFLNQRVILKEEN